ncbi:NUDIX domain-containing protein [Terrarubrum flagellatum]|uniref:NUDIX domain-containing protein n=1 Tax=Terrirubrum flagellatum TaxID=2895980 RepID=UPI003144D40C
MNSTGALSDRVTIEKVETLSDRWRPLRSYTFRYRRRDGREQTLVREIYERPEGAALLLANVGKGTVVLIRQLRLPALINGHPDGMLWEVPAGLLDDDSPADAMRREAMEETGFRVGDARPLFAAYTSAGAMTERLHFFVAEYADGDRVEAGGGHAGEGEDIEVAEFAFEDALAMIGQGEIVDAKTIMLLLYAEAKGLFRSHVG